MPEKWLQDKLYKNSCNLNLQTYSN
jgi:hypothetical protein